MSAVPVDVPQQRVVLLLRVAELIAVSLVVVFEVKPAVSSTEQ